MKNQFKTLITTLIILNFACASQQKNNSVTAVDEDKGNLFFKNFNEKIKESQLAITNCNKTESKKKKVKKENSNYTIKISIAKTGEVTKSEVTAGENRKKPVEKCLIETIQKLNFGTTPYSGNITMSHTVNFSEKK